VKKGVLIGLLLIVIAGAWVGELLWYAGQFKTLEPHFGGSSHPVSGLIGAEDITIHPATGVAYISTCDRRAVKQGLPGRGALYAYNLNAADPDPVNLTPTADVDFQPHGISLYVSDHGPDVLFVINHQARNHRIEIYELDGSGLSLRQTVSDPMLVSPNDLAAVGPRQFYVTNDHRRVSGLGMLIEDYGRLRNANVVFFDGTRFSEALSGIGCPNGINLSRDGRTLYLAATTERTLYAFDRDPETNRLILIEKVDLRTGVDNIELDRDGGLWVAGHPKMLQFVKHAEDPSVLSPSQILHLTPRPDGGFAIVEVYLNDGREISAASVAAVFGRRMLVGSVFEPIILDCRLP
jgi:arylesterase/paraoxonase